MKKLILFVVASLVLNFPSISFAEMKIGVLDVNRVLSSTQQIKNIQTNLKKLFDPRGQEIVILQQSFRADIEKYRQNNVNLRGDALKKEQQRLIDKNNELQEAQLVFQRDLVAAQNQALHPVLTQINNIVNKIAQERKFDLIVVKAGTVYNNPQIEITDQVIAETGKADAGKVETKKAEVAKSSSAVAEVEKDKVEVGKLEAEIAKADLDTSSPAKGGQK